MSSSNKDRYFLKSLASGIRAMEVIAESDHALTLSEVANLLKTNKTTATRICYTLSELQILHRNEHNKYSLTPKVLKFGYASLCSLGWREIAKFYLERLSNETNETVTLSVLEETKVMFLLRLRKGDFFPFDTGIGTRLPAHCTSMGKVLLAFQSDKKRELILDKIEFSPLTVHSIQSREKLVEELNEVKRKGFAINYEEISIGVCGISAPIINMKDEAIAAISISSTTAKYNEKDMETKLASVVIRTARQISEAIDQMDPSRIY